MVQILSALEWFHISWRLYIFPFTVYADAALDIVCSFDQHVQSRLHLWWKIQGDIGIQNSNLFSLSLLLFIQNIDHLFDFQSLRYLWNRFFTHSKVFFIKHDREFMDWFCRVPKTRLVLNLKLGVGPQNNENNDISNSLTCLKVWVCRFIGLYGLLYCF